MVWQFDLGKGNGKKKGGGTAGTTPVGGTGGGSTQDIEGGTVEYAAGTEADLMNRANQVDAEETKRYEGGLGVIQDAYASSKKDLSTLLDQDLLFSRASDAVGARAGRGLESLRSSLGSRGINPNSGAAGGMMQRMMMSQQGQLIGAKRDIALENQNVRHRNAAVNFANALNLGQYQNSPVSVAGMDMSTNIFEGNLAREGIASMERSQKRASKDAKMGSLGGGALGLAGGAIGGK